MLLAFALTEESIQDTTDDNAAVISAMSSVYPMNGVKSGIKSMGIPNKPVRRI